MARMIVFPEPASPLILCGPFMVIRAAERCLWSKFAISDSSSAKALAARCCSGSSTRRLLDLVNALAPSITDLASSYASGPKMSPSYSCIRSRKESVEEIISESL